MSLPPVIIAGSGPAGLLLGQALKKAGIAFRIFERDAGLGLRAQGYRFRLTAEGVLGLRDSLTAEHFALLQASCAANRPFPDAFNVDALTGEAVQTAGPPRRDNKGAEPLLADRTVFRTVLARGLEADIEFGREVVGYEASAGGESVLVKFKDGSSTEGAMLVAADGSWSRIRSQYLPEFVPVDTEARWIYGKTTITPALREAVDPRFFDGMQLLRDTSRFPPLTLVLESMTFDRSNPGLDLPPDYIYWVLGSRSDRLDFADLPKRPSSETCAELSRKITANWYPAAKPLFGHQDEGQSSVLSIPSMRPPLPSWEASRVVLVGDAAHCMMPTSGIGATTALRDIAYLGKLFTEEGITIESVRKYEVAMREWANVAITQSGFGGKHFIGMREMADLKPFASERQG